VRAHGFRRAAPGVGGLASRRPRCMGRPHSRDAFRSDASFLGKVSVGRRSNSAPLRLPLTPERNGGLVSVRKPLRTVRTDTPAQPPVREGPRSTGATAAADLRGATLAPSITALASRPRKPLRVSGSEPRVSGFFWFSDSPSARAWRAPKRTGRRARPATGVSGQESTNPRAGGILGRRGTRRSFPVEPCASCSRRGRLTVLRRGKKTGSGGGSR